VLLGYCDDRKRATKLRGNPQQDIVLVNELVVARLAEIVDAPCPEGRVVRVDEPIIRTAREALPQLSTAQAGLCFGSIWIEGTYSPSESVCRDASNRAQIAAIIVLYTWCRNTDAKDTHLVWRVAGDGRPQVYGFDHGHCFDYAWDPSIRDRAASVTVPAIPSSLTLAVQASDFAAALDRLSRPSRDELEASVQGIPPEWGRSPEDVAALVDYLDASRPATRIALTARFGG
jgi:hypothetical protein